MENYDKFLPNNSKVILDKIFYGLIESFRASYLNAIYYDLFEKYEREMSLIKSDNKAANLVNRAFKGVKNINAKVSHKSNIMQKLERTEIVERLFSEEKYKIYNFEWNVKVLNANTYEEKEILSNALESYDKFEDAIDAGVIEINSTLVIMNTVKSDISKFTDILKLKLDSNSISFDRYDVEFGEMFDDVLIEMLVDYVNLRDTPDINLDEDEIEDKYLIASDALNYLMYEYYLELRSLTLRLFNVYCYFINNNKKMENMNIKDYYILQNAIHYFNLEDEAENIELDDDYLKDYDELSTFYRLFINNLSVILQFAVTEKDEFEELNKPSKEYDIEDNTIVVNPQNNELDFENLTHQLVLAIKRSKKNK